MSNFFVVLYIIGLFDLSHVGERQMTSDYNTNTNTNSNNNINTVGIHNQNSGNSHNSVNFGKWKFFPSVASWAWKTGFRCSRVSASLVDLTFLARQERRSNNCKSSETIKVFNMQFIVCVVTCQRNFAQWVIKVTSNMKRAKVLVLVGYSASKSPPGAGSFAVLLRILSRNRRI